MRPISLRKLLAETQIPMELPVQCVTTSGETALQLCSIDERCAQQTILDDHPYRFGSADGLLLLEPLLPSGSLIGRFSGRRTNPAAKGGASPLLSKAESRTPPGCNSPMLFDDRMN